MDRTSVDGPGRRHVADAPTPPGRIRIWWRDHPLVSDGAVAAALALFTLGSFTVWERTIQALGSEDLPSTAWSVLLLLLLVAPIALRRVLPSVAIIWTSIAFAAVRFVDVPEPTGSSIVYFVALVSAGIHLDPPWRRWLRLGSVAVVGLGYARSLWVFEADPEIEHLLFGQLLYDVAFNAAYFGAAWLLGNMFRLRLEREQHLVERARLLEAEQTDALRRAVDDERFRIARELHDVVAHHVSLMGVQAGAARRVIDRDRDATVQALSTIEHTGRQAVDELYRLLGFLRSGTDESADAQRIAPQPSVRCLDELIADARSTGLVVDVVVDDDIDGLPQSLDVSAYRIVQEALTNTRKHARARRVEIRITRDERHLGVEVRDDGIGSAAAVAPDDGRPQHGLLGMRERVELLGGRLDTGPRPGGGYRVRARLPLSPGRDHR